MAKIPIRTGTRLSLVYRDIDTNERISTVGEVIDVSKPGGEVQEMTIEEEDSERTIYVDHRTIEGHGVTLETHQEVYEVTDEGKNQIGSIESFGAVS